MSTRSSTHLGKKILYTIVIALCSLIIILSAAEIIGVWIIQRPLTNTIVTIFSIVEDTARTIKGSTIRIDQILSDLQTVTVEFKNASDQISKNVTDKGLVMVLLPEEREQQLVNIASSVKDVYSGAQESVTAILDLYRSIDRLPFVSLPGLTADQVDRIESSIANIQTLAETLQSEIASFRSGLSNAIDKVGGVADLLNNEIVKVREELSQLNSKMSSLEALSIRMQQVIPGIFIALALIISLLMAFIIYTQVEMIRLYVARWRLLGQPSEISPFDTLPPSSEEIEVKSEED